MFCFPISWSISRSLIVFGKFPRRKPIWLLRTPTAAKLSSDRVLFFFFVGCRQSRLWDTPLFGEVFGLPMRASITERKADIHCLWQPHYTLHWSHHTIAPLWLICHHPLFDPAPSSFQNLRILIWIYWTYFFLPVSPINILKVIYIPCSEDVLGYTDEIRK
jgi:hypothetical protein